MNEIMITNPPPPMKKTLLLMHFDAAGTRNYFDECGTPVTVAATAGLMEAGGRIGGCGFYSDYQNKNGKVTPQFNWDPNGGDWTIEFWVMRFGGIAYMYKTSGVTGSNAAHVEFDNSGMAIFFINGVEIFRTGAHLIGLNIAWGHIAFVCKDDVYSLYVNGVLRASVTGSTNPLLRQAKFKPFDIFNPVSYGNNNNGLLVDELRISSVARYSADFTVPTVAFTVD